MYRKINKGSNPRNSSPLISVLTIFGLFACCCIIVSCTSRTITKSEDPQVTALRNLEERSQTKPYIRFENGLPRFISVQIAIPDTLPDDPVAIAIDYLTKYRDLYQLANPYLQLHLNRIVEDESGGHHLFFGQHQYKIPVFAAELAVHLERGYITGTNGNYLSQIPLFPPPSINATDAEEIALANVPGTDIHRIGEPKQIFFNLGLFAGIDADTHLSWRVPLRGYRTSDGAATSWLVFVDAIDESVLFIMDQAQSHGDPDIKGHRPGEDFDIETGNHDMSCSCWITTTSDDRWFDEHGTTSDYPGTYPGGDIDGDNAFIFTHKVYHYFYDKFLRRSYDGDDEDVEVYVHVGENWVNAHYSLGCDIFEFGDGMVSQDVLVHEYTHGVTNSSSNLIYYSQPGALSESYSDFFAAMLDTGSEWIIGEDTPANCEGRFAGGFVGGTVGNGNPEWGNQCGNGIDDDGDGFTDEGCPEVGNQCGNGIDDDGDGFTDEGCPEVGNQCGNGIDDDGDGFTDEGCPGNCNDQIDNDLDGGNHLKDKECYERDMSNPPAHDQPDIMSDFLLTTKDDGGVHTNSGIPNKVAYLITEGGTHNGIKINWGLGKYKTQRLYYDVLTKRLTSNAQFLDFRDATISQLNSYWNSNLYGYGFTSNDKCRVINAFASVGLGFPDRDCDGLLDDADTDDDGDHISDDSDNCPLVANPNQIDTDSDGIGDACDPDDDGDNWLDNQDNCPLIYNPTQADDDNDFIGDVCDDDDKDGLFNPIDNCRYIYNPSQKDMDKDGLGDPCDPDTDGDGILNDGDGSGSTVDNRCTGGNSTNCDDNCPKIPNTDQLDRDNDVYGDICDNCPDTYGNQADTDGDGSGDICDADDDNDGILDENDPCPKKFNLPNEIYINGVPLTCLSDYMFEDISGLIWFREPSEVTRIPIFPCLGPKSMTPCPNWLPENYWTEVKLSLPYDLPVRIVDDRGFVVSKSKSGIDKIIHFRPKADYFYRLPIENSEVSNLDSTQNFSLRLSEDIVYRGTQYFLEIFPTPEMCVEEQYPIKISVRSFIISATITFGGTEFEDPKNIEVILKAIPWVELINQISPDQNIAIPVESLESGLLFSDVFEIPFEPDSAKQIITETGLQNNIKIRLLYSPDNSMISKIASVVGDAMNKLGIKYEPKAITEVSAYKLMLNSIADGELVIWVSSNSYR